MRKSAPKGFTLVELLVVISIIAILSVIGITVFTNVQKNARDAKRRGDIDAISKALEVHYQDGQCPPNNYCPPYPSYFSGNTTPKDPLGGNYIYNGSSTADTGGLLPGDNSIGGTTRSANTWKICADLESNGRTTGNQEDYCRSNQQ